MTWLLGMLLLAAIPVRASGTLCDRDLAKRVRPCTAFPEEQKGIMRFVQEGVRAHVEYGDAVRKEERLRLRAESKGHLWGTDQYYDALTEHEDALKDMQDAKSRMESNFKAAIRDTQIYYGLNRNPGPIRNGLLAGQSAGWDPRFVYAPEDENGDYEPVVRESKLTFEGKPYLAWVQFSRNDDSATAASTDEDGGVNVSFDAFQKVLDMGNAGNLASVLYHERVHFDDLGVKDGWSSKEKTEASAYGKELDKAEIFELEEEDVGFVRDMEVFWKQRYKEVKRKNRVPTVPYPPTIAEQRETQKGLSWMFEYDQDILKAIRRGQAELKGRIETERRVRRSVPEASPRALHFFDIKAAVVQGCRPLAAPEEWLLYLNGKQWFPEADRYESWMGDDLTECSKDLWDMFVEGRAKLLDEGASDVAIDLEKLAKATARMRRYYAHSDGTHALVGLVGKACSGPGRITIEDLKPLVELTFPNPRLSFRSVGGIPSVRGCQQELYESIQDFNRTWQRGTRLNVGWLRWEAARLIEKYRPPEAPVAPSIIEPEPDRWRGKPIDWPSLDEILRRL